MEKTRRIITFSVVLCVSGALQDIPPFMEICHRSDPDLQACMKRSVEGLRPQLKQGNAEYNIPSVEPLIINDLIKENTGGLKIETTNVVAYGGGDYEVSSLSIDLDTYKVDVDIFIPKLMIDATYEVDGKLVMLPIRGGGKFNANLTNCHGRAFLTGKVSERDGAQYLQFAENKMKVTVGDGKVQLDNLFNGDKAVNKMINDVINDNLQMFLKELLPPIEKGLARNFLNTGNQVIAPYTIEQLFPQ